MDVQLMCIIFFSICYLLCCSANKEITDYVTVVLPPSSSNNQHDYKVIINIFSLNSFILDVF